jgi:hypothetical protein
MSILKALLSAAWILKDIKEYYKNLYLLKVETVLNMC